MVFSLSACGSAKKQESIPLASNENIYTEEEIPLPEGVSNVSLLGSDGENIFISGSSGGAESVFTLGTDGSLISEKKLPEGRYIRASATDTEGYLWTAEAVSPPPEPDDGAQTDQGMNFNEEFGGQGFVIDSLSSVGQEELHFVKYDKNGEVISEIPVPETTANENINSFTLGTNGNIYAVSENSVYVIDAAGKLLYKISEEGEGTDGDTAFNTGAAAGISGISGIYRLKNGEIAVLENRMEMDGDVFTNKNIFNLIDTENQKYGDSYELAADFNTSIQVGNSEYDVLFSDSSSLKGYDLKTGTETVITDWLQSGIDGGTVQSSLVFPDGRILGVLSDYNSSFMSMGGMTRVSVSMSPGGGRLRGGGSGTKLMMFTESGDASAEKELVTIAVFYLDDALKNAVVNFNKTSNKYRIEVKSYSEGGDYQNAESKLNNDIISGNIPDILALNGSMLTDSYIAKGIFADIKEFINKDDGINEEDYLQNIFDAYSSGGKLYSIVPGFTICTVAVRQSDADGKTGWDMNEFIKFTDENPEENIFSNMTKNSFMTYALDFSSGSYINRETGECSFNTDDFISLLNIANGFPQELENSGGMVFFSSAEGGGGGRFSVSAEGGPGGGAVRPQRKGLDALLSSEYIGRFITVRELEKAVFAEPVTFIGFPSANGSGSSISADMELSITSKAKNPDGAWEFCKYFLSDEYQDSLEYSFPVKLSALEKQMKEAMENPYYMDGGEKIEYENTYRMDMTTEIEIGVNDEADSEKMMNLIKSVSEPIRNDTTLTNIIMEEADAFFNGQKTAGEAAEIIQNRVSTYVSENR